MDKIYKSPVRVSFTSVCYTHGILATQFLILDSNEELKKEAFHFLEEGKLKGKTDTFFIGNKPHGIYFAVDFENADDFALFLQQPLKDAQLIDFRISLEGKTTPEALIECARKIDEFRISQIGVPALRL